MKAAMILKSRPRGIIMLGWITGSSLSNVRWPFALTWKIIWFSIYVISENICSTAKSLPIEWISISSKDGDGWNHSMRLFVSILLKHGIHWMLLSNYLRNCSRGCSYSTIKVEHKATHCTSSTKPQTDERKGMVLKNMNPMLFRGKMNLHCENCFIYFNWGNL